MTTLSDIASLLVEIREELRALRGAEHRVATTPTKPSISVQTIEELIMALGGTVSARRLLGGSPQAFWNWRAAKSFPKRLFVVHQQVLSERNIVAPPSLWGIEEPEGAAA